jgi:hypothetical protein
VVNKRVLFLSCRDGRIPHRFDVSLAETMHTLGRNSGNIAFIRAIQTYLEAAGTPYDVQFYGSHSPPLAADWDRYGACVINCANWLAPGTAPMLEKIARDFAGVKVPTFMIGLGAQADSYGSFDFLHSFAAEAKAFIAALLETGGGFGLRGPFTGACFDVLGFAGHYTVTGCPSLYQRGRGLRVDEARASLGAFKPLLNGRAELQSAPLLAALEASDGAFVCQDEMIGPLKFFSGLTPPQRRGLLTRPEPMLALMAGGRVRVFADLERWTDFILAGGYNFSYGGRIHGNVIPVLAGVPAVIAAGDSRTREIAEVFALPMARGAAPRDLAGLHDLYQGADFGPFHRAFPQRCDDFEAFLARHNLPMALPETKPLAVGSVEADETDPGLVRFLRAFLDFKSARQLERWLPKQRQYVAWRAATGWPT